MLPFCTERSISRSLPSCTGDDRLCKSVAKIYGATCANLSDVMAPYVVEPDAYAPLPQDIAPNVNACVGYNGRWVSANSCG